MTVSKIVKRILRSGSVENKARSGRPEVVTDRDYRKLQRLIKVNRRDSSSDITSKFNEVRDRRLSKRTVQYHLNKHGFNRRVSRKRVVIWKVNKKKKKKKKKDCRGVWKSVDGL